MGLRPRGLGSELLGKELCLVKRSGSKIVELGAWLLHLGSFVEFAVEVCVSLPRPSIAVPCCWLPPRGIFSFPKAPNTYMGGCLPKSR